MKKYLIIILLAVCTGSLFGLFIFSKNKEETIKVSNEVYKVSLFQVGVFKNPNNAERLCIEHQSSIIVHENELYWVYVALYNNEKNILKYQKYLEEKQINYYLKEDYINENQYIKIKEYESLIETTTNYEVINKTNQLILDLYLSYKT